MVGSLLTRLKLPILLMVFFRYWPLPCTKNSKGENSIYDYMSSPEPTSFGLLPTSPQEVINLANLAKYSRSPGPDGIDPLIARKTIESVAGVVSAIIRLKQGLFPQI